MGDIEIPNEGDLRQISEEHQKELKTLSADMETAAGNDVTAKDAFERLKGAILTGNRTRVVAALRNATQEQFNALRSRMDAAQENVGYIDDQAVLVGEQMQKSIARHTIPSWLRIAGFGTAIGGGISLALLPVQWIVRPFSLAAKNAIASFRGQVFSWTAGVSLAAGLGKGVTDAIRQGSIGAMFPETWRKPADAKALAEKRMNDIDAKVRANFSAMRVESVSGVRVLRGIPQGAPITSINIKPIGRNGAVGAPQPYTSTEANVDAADLAGIDFVYVLQGETRERTFPWRR